MEIPQVNGWMAAIALEVFQLNGWMNIWISEDNRLSASILRAARAKPCMIMLANSSSCPILEAPNNFGSMGFFSRIVPPKGWVALARPGGAWGFASNNIREGSYKNHDFLH